MPIFSRLFKAIAPHDCLVCGEESDLLCQWCLPDARESIPVRCYRCHALSRDSKVCKSCRRNSRLTHVWVANSYRGVPELLARSLKFKYQPAAVVPMANLMDGTLPYLPGDTIVTNVPTATVRQRQRGYDHAALLAKEIAKQKQLPYLPLLRRSGQARQVGADKRTRQQQVKGAFRAINSRLLDGRNVLLVDDILTTGATVEEAAKTLKLAGAKTVNAAIFAQKQ